MTLRGILAAQLRLQACWTGEARLAHAFALFALTRIPLAVLLAHARSLLTPFRRFAWIRSAFQTWCAFKWGQTPIEWNAQVVYGCKRYHAIGVCPHLNAWVRQGRGLGAAMISYDFSGKTVVVTGSARGIGRRIAECYYQAGANVAFCGCSFHVRS